MATFTAAFHAVVSGNGKTKVRPGVVLLEVECYVYMCVFHSTLAED